MSQYDERKEQRTTHFQDVMDRIYSGKLSIAEGMHQIEDIITGIQYDKKDIVTNIEFSLDKNPDLPILQRLSDTIFYFNDTEEYIPFSELPDGLRLNFIEVLESIAEYVGCDKD